MTDWTPKQKRGYHRILSGLKVARNTNTRLRFMTVTTSFENKDTDIQDSARILIKRIKRRSPTFEYYRVKTNEGNGVLHFLFKGAYIPQKWLSNQWNEIHKSPIVDVRNVDLGGRGVAAYLVTQYLATQDKATYTRMSWSWGWVFKGFVGRWYLIKKLYPTEAIKKWNLLLQGHDICIDNYWQTYIKGYPDIRIMSLEQVMLDSQLVIDLPQDIQNKYKVWGKNV